jgi:hypothetical protein
VPALEKIGGEENRIALIAGSGETPGSTPGSNGAEQVREPMVICGRT